jgi:hypothetical protein
MLCQTVIASSSLNLEESSTQQPATLQNEELISPVSSSVDIIEVAPPLFKDEAIPTPSPQDAPIPETNGTIIPAAEVVEPVIQTPALLPLTTQHKGTSLFFQDVSKKKFSVIRKLSNFLNFSVPDQVGELKTYNFLVAQLFPKILDGKIELGVYIAFITPLYTNEWEIFTGIDNLTGFPCTLRQNSTLHPLLSIALSEMILYMPELSNPEVLPQKICNISCMYPENWSDFLREIITNTQTPPSSFEGFYTTIQKVFDSLPHEEIKGINVYLTLAQFQPFKVSARTHRLFLTQNISSLLLMGQIQWYAKQLLYFDSLEDSNFYQTVSFARNQNYTTINGIASALKKSIDEEIKAKKNPAITTACDGEYFDISVLKKLYIFKKHALIWNFGQDLSFLVIKEFVESVTQRFKDQQTDSENELGAIGYLETLVNEGQKVGPVKESAVKLIQRLKKAIDTHLEKTNLFSLPPDFGSVIADFHSPEMNQLFEQQTSFMASQTIGSTKAKTLTFEVQLHFILSYLELFRRLHEDMVIIGKNFEFYYQGVGRKDQHEIMDKKSFSSDEEEFNDKKPDDDEQFQDNDPQTLSEDRKTKILNEQPEEEIKALYLDFEKIIYAIRKIYPNFGYLPSCFNKNALHDNSILTPNLETRGAEPADGTSLITTLPATVLANPVDAGAEDPTKTVDTKPLKVPSVRAGLPQKLAKRVPKADATAKK